MEIVPLTLTVSLCLVLTFVLFFLREHTRGRYASAERDSLLPLAEEKPRAPAALDRPLPAAEEDHRCGCRDGSRPPCSGCLRRR